MEDVMHGRWCRPRPAAAGSPAGVEAGDTAGAAGFEAAVVDLPVHLEQFAPLLTEHFGDDWWHRGAVGIRAVTQTVAGEPVRCYLEPEPPSGARLWMNAEGEELVLEGNARLGGLGGGPVRKALGRAGNGDAIRLLAAVTVGDETPWLPTRIEAADADRHLPEVCEPVSCYRDDSVFGGRVASAALVTGVMGPAAGMLVPVPAPLVSLTGALEIEYLNGPVLVDRDYRVRGRVLALNAAADAEELWYETELQDTADHTPVARMLRMDRLVEGP